MRNLYPVLFLFLFPIFGFAQGMIEIKGVVYDADSNQVLDSVTIIVKHTSRIMQNKPDGRFSIFIKPSDTLIFGLFGYRVKYLCFKDSVRDKDYYNIKVRMMHLSENIREVTINQVRTQREIRKDIQNLAIAHVMSMERSNAILSPISAMYEKYNKKSRTKQMLVEYEFELEKNKLIKQLLDIYNSQGIIDIPRDSYKAFIKSLQLDWDFITIASDYELAVFIKKKAALWKERN